MVQHLILHVFTRQKALGPQALFAPDNPITAGPIRKSISQEERVA